MEEFLIYTGKVRNVYNLGENYLLMRATDRVSSFDKHIGDIPGKGKLLNKMSEFWFEQTKHIINNHIISTQDDIALVHKCTPFSIEIIVRGYITGNTNTSLWTHYNEGKREYCGIQLPDGLKKNHKLEQPIITPTTKGITDVPISKEDIIKDGYMTLEECNYIYEKALELFNYGQTVADAAGLILVDTKYEFGKDNHGQILLIDELHTCDSSRYWLKSSYNERITSGLEPNKLDKDCIRDWVKSNCDPYNDPIPAVPDNIIQKAYENYNLFYDMITNINEFPYTPLPTPIQSPIQTPQSSPDKSNIKKNTLVVILSGSIKDFQHVEKISKSLDEKHVQYVTHVASAHKNTKEVLNIIDRYDNQNDNKIIWVTVAGKSNALSGVVAANSNYPVIACPKFDDKMDMMVNINSSLQCPSGVPVMTILDPNNVVGAIVKITNL